MKKILSIMTTALMSSVCLSSASFAEESYECQEGTYALINPLDHKLSCIPQNVVHELKSEINATNGECPEAMVAMINAENYDRICLPKTLVMGHVASSKTGTQTSEDSQPPEAASIPDESTKQADTEAPYNTQATAPASTDITHEASSDESTEDSDYRAFLTRDDDIASAITKGGASLTYGMGYGFIAALDLRLEAGYQFQYLSDSHVGFGLYAAFNLRTGYPSFTMDAVLVPKFHVSKNNFRFSLGLGLGLFYTPTTSWDSDPAAPVETSKATPMWFQIRPELNFDWFLSKNAWLGFGFDTPLIMPSGLSLYVGQESKLNFWIDIFLHVGYKF